MSQERQEWEKWILTASNEEMIQRLGQLSDAQKLALLKESGQSDKTLLHLALEAGRLSPDVSGLGSPAIGILPILTELQPYGVEG